jgi:hypothetical protein
VLIAVQPPATAPANITATSNLTKDLIGTPGENFAGVLLSIVVRHVNP